MIVAAIITYNDIPILEKCIDSIYNKVDRIIVIDGKYKDFPGESPYSTDGTLEYVDWLSRMEEGKISLIKAKDYLEVDKRNLYFKFLNNGDTFLNLDADEILTGNIPKLDTDIGIIMIGERNQTKRHLRTIRFFIYRKGLHYWGRHTLILDGDDKVFADLQHVGNGYTSKKIWDFELIHRNDLRSVERDNDKKEYYKILMAREAKINVPAN